jgi:hypothetical protein
MAKKKTATPEAVVRKAFPTFEVVEPAKQDDAFLPPDSVTPDVKTLHRKYRSDSAAEEASLAAAESVPEDDTTQAVIIEPRERTDTDAPAKRLTVLVKKGKIRAVQG